LREDAEAIGNDGASIEDISGFVEKLISELRGTGAIEDSNLDTIERDATKLYDDATNPESTATPADLDASA
jgi:hypothetical protein